MDLRGSSRKKGLDDAHDDPSEKSDERVEDTEVEQADEDEESEGFDAGEKIRVLSEARHRGEGSG
jgi:hypothetical protein